MKSLIEVYRWKLVKQKHTYVDSRGQRFFDSIVYHECDRFEPVSLVLNVADLLAEECEFCKRRVPPEILVPWRLHNWEQIQRYVTIWGSVRTATLTGTSLTSFPILRAKSTV